MHDKTAAFFFKDDKCSFWIKFDNVFYISVWLTTFSSKYLDCDLQDWPFEGTPAFLNH